MMLGGAKGNRPLIIFLGLMVASLAALPLLPPIPQDQDYHNFADVRAWLGIPNVWNVISNLPFIAAGAVGLARCREAGDGADLDDGRIGARPADLVGAHVL